MAGGGTGGHVIPALAVARELQQRGQDVLFVGTSVGLEAKLVPAAGFPLEYIEIGGLKNVGVLRKVRSIWQLMLSTAHVGMLIGQRRPSAVFSMGGYVAGPVVIAAILRGIPFVIMEPNAVPGFTNRKIARQVYRALISFPETARYFPEGRTEQTGLPVREEFFRLAPKPRGEVFTVLITGGSQGSRTLNEAARQSWPLFRESGLRVRLVHQAGPAAAETLAREFVATGLEGEVVPFILDMPAAFAGADLVVCRSGAGAVSELAAAGKPSILVPFPYAADQHQLRNAEAMQRQGAARLVLDREMNGESLLREVRELASDSEALAKMGQAARGMARPGASQRAAEILMQAIETRETH
jgi:UDP-N-acetylglucosamine--N-acetylmuramyl-(pentapeptide) pyrophosphoryl-undecaprenol N-acetylglucosamine transferase